MGDHHHKDKESHESRPGHGKQHKALQHTWDVKTEGRPLIRAAVPSVFYCRRVKQWAVGSGNGLGGKGGMRWGVVWVL